MRKFGSLFTLITVLVGLGLSQCMAPVPAFSDTTVENNNGLWVKDAASGRYEKAGICYSTDGSGNLVPCAKVPGGVGMAPLFLNTASTNVTASAVVSLGTPSAQTHYVSVYNGTSDELILSTGSTGSWSPVAYIPATSSLDLNLYVAPGTYFGAESNASTASSGHILVNLLQ